MVTLNVIKSFNSPVNAPLQGHSSLHTKCLKYPIYRHSPRPYLLEPGADATSMPKVILSGDPYHLTPLSVESASPCLVTIPCKEVIM